MAGLPKCVEGAGQKEVHVPMSGAAGGNSNGRVDVDSDMQDATSDVSQLSEDELCAKKKMIQVFSPLIQNRYSNTLPVRLPTPFFSSRRTGCKPTKLHVS